MNDKEFNLQILAALTEYANGLVAAGRVTVEESGQYTAANLASGKNDLGEYLHIDITEQNERKTLQVGGFSCTVTPYTVFAIICKFEKICRVKGDKKARFAFGDGQSDIIKGRAMFVDGKGNVKTRTKALRRQTEHTATDKNEAIYYQVTPGGVWYCVTDRYVKAETVAQSITADFVRDGIERCKGSSFDPIYDALLAELEANERAKDVEPAGKVVAIEVETKPIKQEKPKRTQGARFTFSACGIQPGEKIVFTPEQIEVTVADDTHIEFCGELFTLSGFCKAFMPDGKRKPSNAYQGPKYFTYNGVTLVKLRTEKAICVEVETEAVETEGNTLVLPSKLVQERTKAHDQTTAHGVQNSGLKRIFIGSTKVHLSEATMCRMESFIKRGYEATHKVVHTMPLPPPFYQRQRYGR